MEKAFQAKEKLTDKEINPLKNYVGMAIRQDCNNVFEMTNAAIAMLYHYTALKLKVYVICIVRKERIVALSDSQTKKQVK